MGDMYLQEYHLSHLLNWEEDLLVMLVGIHQLVPFELHRTYVRRTRLLLEAVLMTLLFLVTKQDLCFLHTIP